MITTGMDIGSKTIKILILKDDNIIEKELVTAAVDLREGLKKSWEEVLLKTGVSPGQIKRIVATGVGQTEAFMAQERITEVSAAARGAVFLDREVRTVIDVGAEEGRAIKVNSAGKVIDFVVNEKCAAGTGAFIEAMARALEVALEELGPLSLQATQDIGINAQCAVFAESELVSLVHAQTPKADMARAIHAAIADRIAALARRVGLENKIMLIGGLAKNVGFISSLQKELATDLTIPDHPEFVSALGAALIAAGR